MSVYQKLLNKEAKLSLIGLGYVGLPIALEFAKKISVIGFDINEERVEMMRQGIDPSNELDPSAFENCDIHFASDPDDLRKADFHIIAVPTPIDDNHTPDLGILPAASKTVGNILKKGDYVVYESTVYPGATEEDCIPILEELSGLKFCDDFKVGFSPERINPGDKVHTISTIKKIVSSCDDDSLDIIAKVYEMVVTAGVHKASSIKVAEAAKIIENTQRDVNIGLMNELSMIFDRMGINTYEVIEAASTKWNFLKFYPGLVGGHCIGVDPYYLAYKAKKFGYNPQIINSGRFVNDSMGFYVARQLVKKIIATGKSVIHSKVLVMGATFKEDVSDIRNSKVVDIITELDSYGVKVDVTDPFASKEEFFDEYSIKLTDKIAHNYDAVVVAVNHKPYFDFDEDYFISITTDDAILVDVKGIFNNKVKKLVYWSL